MNEFNSMLAQLAVSLPNVCYIDVRTALEKPKEWPDNYTYECFWANELHPTEGFYRVAEQFDKAIKSRCAGKIK